MKKTSLIFLITLVLFACSSHEDVEIETYEEQDEARVAMFSQYVVDPQSSQFNYLLRENQTVIIPYYREENFVNLLALDLEKGSYELLYSGEAIDSSILPEWPKLLREEDRILMNNFQGYFFFDEKDVFQFDDRFQKEDRMFYIDQTWYSEEEIKRQDSLRDYSLYTAKDFYNQSVLIYDPDQNLAYLKKGLKDAELLTVFDDASALVYETGDLRSDPQDPNAPQRYDAYLKRIDAYGKEEVLLSYENLPSGFSQHFYSYHADRLVLTTPDGRMHHFNRQGEKVGEYPSFEISGLGSYAETRFLGANETDHYYWMSISRKNDLYRPEKVIVKIPKDSDRYEDFTILAAYDEAQISGGSSNIFFDENDQYIKP